LTRIYDLRSHSGSGRAKSHGNPQSAIAFQISNQQSQIADNTCPMKCPSCGAADVYHSRAKSMRDQVMKRLLPVSFYRCHNCNWRRAKYRGGIKATLAYTMSLIGYIGGATLILAIIAGILILTLTFLGIPMPWNG
jgi:DNA-directed RNA polymerase subunit M/transcription elongation factor TFIIS